MKFGISDEIFDLLIHFKKKKLYIWFLQRLVNVMGLFKLFYLSMNQLT